MKALEWAIDYNRKTIHKIEIAIRNSYIDSLTEQALGGKAVRNAKGERHWDTRHQVPLRLTPIHLFATFITPINKNFHFNNLVSSLSRHCRDPKIKRPQKNRYLMIQRELKSQSQKW